MRRDTSRFAMAMAALGVLWLQPTAVLAAVCAEGTDYQTIDYFKPSTSDYPKYVNQGGFPFSLCNPPHGVPNIIDEIIGHITCDNIDLKGYLYLPKHGAVAGPIRAVTSPFLPVGTIRTTFHDLALIVFVDGSFAGDDPNVPNPNLYPNACNQARFFTQQGYAFLAIVRRGYSPSTGENEMVRQQQGRTDTIEYLANHSFEVHEAITHMRGLSNLTGDPLIDPDKVGVIGHSLGGIVTLFYGEFGNDQPLKDACQCANPNLIAKARALIAPASQSWDGFDLQDGVINDTSPRIEQLKTAAAFTQLPAYVFEPLNDASSRPAVVLAKAAGDFNLLANQVCRSIIWATAPAGEDSTVTRRRIVDTCPLSGREVQSALFPAMTITDPTADSAHGIFDNSPQIWGPSVMEFFARYGVVP